MKSTLSLILSITLLFLGLKSNHAQPTTSIVSVQTPQVVDSSETKVITDSVKTTSNTTSTTSSKKTLPHKEPLSLVAKNLVKVNVTSIPLRNFSFQYERSLTRKISGAISLRLMPNGGLPLKNLAKKIIDDDESWTHIEKIEISNFAITPEVRFYMGKNPLRGFYIAPFARLASYNVDMPVEFEVEPVNPGDPKIEENIPLNGKISSITGGVLFGAQWKLAKSIYLDWWILGPHYGNATGSITGNKNLSQLEQDGLRQAIDSLEDIPFIEGAPKVNDDGVRINVKGPWGGLRSGLSIGYRF